MPDGNNLTIDFNDASFDTSQGDVQPVPNIDVDVVFPLDDNPDLTVASGASDNRTSTAAPASAIALMPTDGMSSSMEEFLFEFDNDLNDDGTADDQGLKVTTSGGSGSQQVVNEINLQGTLENLHTDGSLDIYVSDKDANGNQVFETVTLGEGSDTSGNDNITYVGGDTNGGDTGAGDDIASINVDASATMGGTFLGGAGYDMIKLVEGVDQDNGAEVDFTFGPVDGNSAAVFNFGGVGDGMSFDIDEFESVQLTDNADVIFIASDTGESLTNTYDAAYLNGGGSNSMMKVQTGFTDGGMADVMYVHADSNVYLSFEFANESGLGIQGSFGADGDIDITGHIHGAADVGTDGEVIDVNIDQTGGSGNLTIDYLEATSNHDMITNLGDIGITVDLGGSDGMADVFTGSSTSDNDVLDAREVHDLKFETSTYNAEYIRVKDVGSTTDGEHVNADLKDVDFIMVRDRAQGPEVTQADVNVYNQTTTSLQEAVTTAQGNVTTHETEQARLDGLVTTAEEAVTTAEGAVTTAKGNANTHASGKAALEEAVTTAQGNVTTHETEQARLDGLVTTAEEAVTTAEGALTTAKGNANTHASGKAALEAAVTTAQGNLNNASVPITQSNLISTVEAFMNSRLDADGLQFFTDNGGTASNLITATDTEIAQIKTLALQGIVNADGDTVQFTTSQGFDDFIADIPTLSTAQEIQDYSNLQTAVTTAQGNVTTHETEQARLDGLVTTTEDALTTAEGAVTTAKGNANTHASGKAALEAAVTTAQGKLTNHLDNGAPIITDTDFYQDMSGLYGTGTEFISGLGQGQVDTYGQGYDVVTSAQVNSFATGSDMRVYYEGKHSDFVDTDDIVNGTEGNFDMSEGKSYRGSNWESEVASQSQYGPGQEPGFFIEVSGKKLAVTFDDTKGEWKVDSSAIQVAENASSVINGVTRDVDVTTTSTVTTNFYNPADLQYMFGIRADTSGSFSLPATNIAFAFEENVSGALEVNMYDASDNYKLLDTNIPMNNVYAFSFAEVDRLMSGHESHSITESFTNVNTVSTNAVPEGFSLADAISKQFGITLKDTDHSGTKISNDIYLNATENAIETLMKDGVVSEKAFNFDFYTKVNLEADGGPVTVNVKLAANSDNSSFTLHLDDIDVAVESFHNVAEDAGAGVTSSSEAGEFVKIDNSADIALGNGGDDTYVVGADAGIYGGVALEYGNIGSRGGLTGSIDAVNINSVSSVDDLTFRRGKHRNEEEGNTLFIGDGNGQETVLFDNYNEYLDFRRVEYLTVEDGANNNEIFEIVTNTNLSDWDNEIYVADNDGGDMTVELGGLDYVFGSAGVDNVMIDLDDLIGDGKDGTIKLSGFDVADTLTMSDNGKLSDADEATVEAALNAGIKGGDATVSFSYSGGTLTLSVDSLDDTLDMTNEQYYIS